MKHIYNIFFGLFLVVTLVTTGARAQNATIMTVLRMSPNPSPYLSDWQSRRETATLTATLDRPLYEPVKLMAQVSLNGTVVAETNPAKMPMLTLHQGINTFNAADLIPYQAVSFKGGINQASQRLGRLPEGHFDLCTWFVNAQTGTRIGQSQCHAFTILDINPPTLTSPENGARYARKKLVGGEATTLEFARISLGDLARLVPSKLGELKAIDLGSGEGQTLLYQRLEHKTNVQVPFTWNIDRHIQMDSSVDNDDTEVVFDKIAARFEGMQSAQGYRDFDRIVFQWLSPMVPPSTQIQYRLRIVPVLPGQTAQQSLTNTTSAFDRDGIPTSYYVTVQDIIDWLNQDVRDWFMSVRPAPNAARNYAWAVQAHDASGNAIGKNNGWSETHTFEIGDNDSPLRESFFDVFEKIELPTAPAFKDAPIGQDKPQPCPYQYKVRKGVIYVPDTDGKCKMYAVFEVFKCRLTLGHAGPHEGDVKTVYVFSGKVTCPDGKSDPEPPKGSIIDRKELDKIPFKEDADKADVGVKAAGKEPCPYTEKKLLRTVVGPWKRISTTVRHATWRKTTVAWADVVWQRDIFNVYAVSHCTLEKNHPGPHKMSPPVEVKEKYGSFTEKVTYGVGEAQVPPKPHASDALPQE